MAVERIDEGKLRIEIAERLYKRRKDQHLTQEELAKRAEVSKSFMSELESGVTSGNVLTYIRLARALDCSVQFLLTGEEPPKDATLLVAEHLEVIGGHLEELLDVGRDIRRVFWNKR
jgi:transcriptional regulator with XRE-family HTH domain